MQYICVHLCIASNNRLYSKVQGEKKENAKEKEILTNQRKWRPNMQLVYKLSFVSATCCRHDPLLAPAHHSYLIVAGSAVFRVTLEPWLSLDYSTTAVPLKCQTLFFLERIIKDKRRNFGTDGFAGREQRVTRYEERRKCWPVFVSWYTAYGADCV